MSNKAITIQATVNAPVEKVWAAYNNPQDIKQWNQASPDWHCPASENDLRADGRFKHTMAAKDGSFSFEFSGKYDEVTPMQSMAYTLDDGRKVSMKFEGDSAQTIVTTNFEPEGVNTLEMQEAGWQAILNNFKKHVEQQS